MEEQSSSTQAPLLSPGKYQLTKSSTSLSSSSFIADEADIKPVGSVRDFFREFSLESKKLWYLAAPAIFTTVCQYSLGAITQVFAGHVGTVELAAVSVENSVIAGEILAGPEQDGGDGRDRSSGLGFAHPLQLAPEFHVVVDSGGSNVVYCVWVL
ncbi:hypothetical protein RHGRI_034111 [Rhododendron griersonianum]|uniref:Uncharacterized protein n=1 Tax=Rhododendron griersonianum TaxID=479676 RepID=A0AAV6I3S4_9ERIC|nr:hypothetical protein RHGRI_034111 [Rhododendron griersonianum]